MYERYQLIFHERGVFKGGLSLDAFHHTQVYPSCSECILYLMGISAEQGKADIGILFSEICNQFGKNILWDGKSIDYTYDSYFYFQLQNYYNYYVSQYGAETANNYTYNIYYSAYQSALVHEALKEKAEKAGIKTTSASVTDAVVNSGFYSDGTNTFSQEIYNQATDMQHKQIVSWMKDSIPTDEVINSYASSKVSKGETEFISSLSGEARSFEYITLTGEMYPDADAASYIESHSDLFQSVAFTRVTYATEEEASEWIKNNTEWYEKNIPDFEEFDVFCYYLIHHV